MKKLLSVRSSRFICYIDTKGNASWCCFSLNPRHFAPTPHREYTSPLRAGGRYHFYLLYKKTKRSRFVFPCTHICTGPHRRRDRCQNYLLYKHRTKRRRFVFIQCFFEKILSENFLLTSLRVNKYFSILYI